MASTNGVRGRSAHISTGGAGVVPSGEQSVARCRIALSLGALGALWLDSAAGLPEFTTRAPILWLLLAHLAYSGSVHKAISRRVSLERVAAWTTWIDACFATAIMATTEGPSSPFFVFFVFTVVAVGFRAGLRHTVVITTASLTVYIGLIVLGGWTGDWNLHVMRPLNLAVLGYLVGYMGEQRLGLEKQVRELNVMAERNAIARSLHDGYVQALAGVNLRLETCQELLRRGRPDDALREMAELQTGVTREYDQLRTYIRSLAATESTHNRARHSIDTRVSIQADFTGSPPYVDHVLQVMREAVTNVQRHAQATSATISAKATDSEVLLVAEDDGVGFPEGVEAPWSIASRVRELNGSLHVTRPGASGARLEIMLPHD